MSSEKKIVSKITPPPQKPRRLGRGLDALLGARKQLESIEAPIETQSGVTSPASQATQATSQATPQPTPESPFRELPVAEIRPNQFQPRKTFSPTELHELQDSIKTSGLLQPIIVRKLQDSPGYELVAGERRLRAVTQLGWSTVPAIIRTYDDQTMLTLALIENLQRQDLNAIEEAEGYAQLANEFGLTQSEIAEFVGKDRSTIANFLRILALPPKVKHYLESGALTIGHARPLLALDDETAIAHLADETVQLGLSARMVEQRVRAHAPPSTTPRKGRPQKQDPKSAALKHVEDTLRKKLQTDVSIIPKKDNKGEVRIHYYSHDDLNRLLELLDALNDT